MLLLVLCYCMIVSVDEPVEVEAHMAGIHTIVVLNWYLVQQYHTYIVYHTYHIHSIIIDIIQKIV